MPKILEKIDNVKLAPELYTYIYGANNKLFELHLRLMRKMKVWAVINGRKMAFKPRARKSYAARTTAATRRTSALPMVASSRALVRI